MIKVVSSGMLDTGSHEDVMVEEDLTVNVTGAIVGNTIVRKGAHLIVLGHLDGTVEIEEGGIITVRGSIRLAGPGRIEGELRIGGSILVAPHQSHNILPKGEIYVNEQTVIQMGAVSYLLTKTGSFQAIYGNQSFTVGDEWLKYDYSMKVFRAVNV